MDRPWILVTGASGFIGGRLVKALVDSGEKVRAFVRPGANLGFAKGLPTDRLQLAYGDIMVEHTVYRALVGVGRVFHVASAFKTWASDRDTIIRPAVEGTHAVLEAARRRDVDKVVVTSSVASLGVTTNADEPMDENHEFNLDDAEAYIESKFRAELVAFDHADAGEPVVVVNPSGVFGPGDWKPTPSGEQILRYLKLPPAVSIPVTSGGVNVVDVDDVVQGHILAMAKGRIGQRYILGGDDLTLREFIDTLSDITGLGGAGRETSRGMAELAGRFLELGARLGGDDPPLTYRLARDFSDTYVWVTSEKAERELGYTHRPAREALTRSVRWYLANGYVPDRAASRVRLELRYGT